MMNLDEVKARISRALGSASPGVEVQLRSISEFGYGGLRTLLGALGVQPDHPLVVGYYRFGGDSVPHKVLGDPVGELVLRPESELDWTLWFAKRRDLARLEAKLSWPDLLVDGHGTWLVWTEDNRSFLCDLA